MPRPYLLPRSHCLPTPNLPGSRRRPAPTTSLATGAARAPTSLDPSVTPPPPHISHSSSRPCRLCAPPSSSRRRQHAPPHAACHARTYSKPMARWPSRLPLACSSSGHRQLTGRSSSPLTEVGLCCRSTLDVHNHHSKPFNATTPGRSLLAAPWILPLALVVSVIKFMVKPRVLVGDHNKQAVEKELGNMVQRCGQFNYLNCLTASPCITT
ncbi:uncharacterized protein [Triticum aestivum]|uniref:uncharacterized protein isoform X2 n=1 Tax=Triticum aestivum TaxID=4565 RepID=UPI001D0349CF|nr:uncharacterized protein LOC123161853 isoform X2 [Triticum aestivum]XP_044435612.1 uncharacterized protein LOC123161853 isoform X2 [Triticum aestivum]